MKNLAIAPEEVKVRRVQLIPDIIFEKVNELITERFDGKSATIKQDDILNAVCNADPCLTRGKIFKNHWLDIEPFYREQGWDVEYDKPAYCEDYPATFKFSVR